VSYRSSSISERAVMNALFHKQRISERYSHRTDLMLIEVDWTIYLLVK